MHLKERVSDEGEHESVHAEGGLTNENEVDTKPCLKDGAAIITVTDQTFMSRQLSFAIAKLLNNEEIILKASGMSIPKAVRMAEICKMRVEYLHQENGFEPINNSKFSVYLNNNIDEEDTRND